MKIIPIPLSGIKYQREALLEAAECGNLWSGALHTATTTTTTNTSAFNYISGHIGDFAVILIPHQLHLLQHTAVGK